MLVAILVTGCYRKVDEPVIASFTPPGITSLADIDVANVAYEPRPIVIEGVVSPSSQGGWPGRNDGYSVWAFGLAAWRRAGEPITERELTVLWPIPPKCEPREQFVEHSIRRMSVLLSADEKRAVFEKALPIEAPDEALLAIAEELKKPVIVVTERLGELVLDRSLNEFRGEAEWNGRTVSVTFDPDENGSIDVGLRVAEQLWLDQGAWKERIDDYAVQELLELKNDTWLE